jgi:hypothetical protein
MSSPGVFLSHNHADKAFVRKLGADLKRCGARVWIDEAEIVVGDSLLYKIGAAIEEMDFLAVVLSPSSVQSEWVKREVEVALHTEFYTKRIKVLPVLHRECEIPPFLRGKAYANFTKELDYTRSVRTLLKSVGLPAEGLILSESECLVAINELARKYDLSFSGLEASPVSSFGTESFRVRRGDGKSVLYCHASNKEVGRAFYVRKGISYFYHVIVGGPESRLGLPTSNEELVDGHGFPTTFFEGGYIQYDPLKRTAKAYIREGKTHVALAEQVLGPPRV